MPETSKRRIGDNRRIPTAAQRREVLKERARWLVRAVFWIGITTGAAALALFGIRKGLQVATTSPMFAIEEISVEGDIGADGTLSADEIRGRSGLALGANLFLSNLAAARERLEQVPWIGSVALTRRLPRRVVIDVEQRRAVAYVDLAGLYLVDQRGQVFKRATADDSLDLPVITGLSRRDFIAGTAELHEWLEMSLALVAPPTGSHLPWDKAELSEVHWDRDLGLSLELGSLPTSVELGFPPFEEKLERLRRTRADLSRRALRPAALYLDDSRQKDLVGMALAGVDPQGNNGAP